MKMIVFLLAIGVIILVAVLAVQKNNTVPPNIGVKNGALAPLPDTPNAVSSQTGQADKQVTPLPFKGDIEQTKARLKKAVADFGGAQILTEQPDYLHAVFTTPIIPFKDDVEFYLDETERQVHYRSASRLGYSDFGVNKKRYTEVRALYERVLN